jgi:8-oxo-dGTP diphosphatase
MEIEIQEHFMNSIHHYKDKSILLMAYMAFPLQSHNILLKDHDQVLWVSKEEMCQFKFAPADVPVVKKLIYK